MTAALANRMTADWKRISRWNAALWLAFLGSFTFHSLAAPAAGVTSPAAPSPPVQTALLEYQEVDYALQNLTIPMDVRSAPFKKEPAWGRNKVLRGTFHFGDDASNAMAFAWDQTARKLYLDLNQNLDLTDDSAGTFVSAEPSERPYDSFTNIHLRLKTPAGERQCLVNLEVWNIGKRRHCGAELRSFWQGKAVLAGAEWQVGIVENPFEQHRNRPATRTLLLRSWRERNQPFSTYSDSQVTFPFSQQLFVRGHACQLDCTDEPVAGKPGLKLQFTEQQPALGELKIAGRFVQRLVLQNGPYLVVMDEPDSLIKIPVGTYRQNKIWLQKGSTEAFRNADRGSDQPITIAADKPTVFAAGGPLTNSVSVQRHGRLLNLNYQLVGAGGGTYLLTVQDRSHPPEFAVYQAGRKIAADKFQYG